MAQIKGSAVIRNLHLAGISESPYIGAKNSVARMIGIDLYTTPGVIGVNQKLTKDSGNTITELCKASVALVDGSQLWFSSESGKIWKRASNGTWSLLYTTVPLTGGAGCLGAVEFEGYVYWATQNSLHRVPSSTAGAMTGVELDWALLNLEDYEFGGTGNSYSIPTSINEADKIALVAYESDQQGVRVNLISKGTGNITVTLHDTANNVVASKTVANASLATGWNLFLWATAYTATVGQDLHLHITSTVGDATAQSLDTTMAGVNVQILTTSSADFHPFIIVNKVLFIGDRQFLHQVEDGIYSSFAVDIPKPYVISALGEHPTLPYVVIGTSMPSGDNTAVVLVWNTWSQSFSSIKPVYEHTVWGFVTVLGGVVGIAGNSGTLFWFDGEKLIPWKQLPGDYSGSKKCKMNYNAVGNYKGLPIFGISNVSGNPTDNAIWSLGQKSISQPKVLNIEYAISSGVGDTVRTSDIEIGNIMVIGNDIYVSWKDSNGTPAYGVDKIDHSNKFTKAFIEERWAMITRSFKDNASRYVVGVVNLPENTSIVQKYQTQYGSTWNTIADNRYDAENIQYAGGEDVQFNTIRRRIEFVVSGNNAPIVDYLAIDFV